jgi:hypothetical protein
VPEIKLPANFWPKIETVKAVAIYGGGLFVLWQVFEILKFVVSLDPVTFGVAAISIVGVLASGVVNFFFGLEQGKQQQKAFESGVATMPNGTNIQNAENVEGGSPTIVTKA